MTLEVSKMSTQRNGTDSALLPELEGTPFDAIHDGDSVSAVVHRMVVQSSALLRMQLEREAFKDPQTYDCARIDPMIREFKAASVDIRDMISDRVRSRLAAHTRQEVHRVLEEALADCVRSIRRRPDSEEAAEALPQDPVMHDPLDRSDAGLHEPMAEAVAAPATVEPQLEKVVDPVVVDSLEEVSAPTDRADEQAPVQPEDPPPSAGDADPGMKLAPISIGSGDELYAGTVRLRMEATSSLREVVRFVDGLRRKPDIRLLQLEGSPRDGVGIRISLRAPLPLRDLLMKMDGVSQVEPAREDQRDGQEAAFNVRLVQAASPA